MKEARDAKKVADGKEGRGGRIHIQISCASAIRRRGCDRALESAEANVAMLVLAAGFKITAKWKHCKGNEGDRHERESYSSQVSARKKEGERERGHIRSAASLCHWRRRFSVQ